MKRADVVMVGAGISALSAAQELRKAGFAPIILEKSRGVGGRASTRRISGVPVDHGTQFFTARSDLFRQQIAAWEGEKICSLWSLGFHRSENRLILPPIDSYPRYACPMGMTAIAKAMSNGLAIEKQCRVIEGVRLKDGFRLSCDDGRVFWGRRLVLSTPAPQILDFAMSILPNNWIRSLKSLRYSPCFAVVAEIHGVDPEWKGLHIDGKVLSWAGADFTKRVPRPLERHVVLHSTGDFARTHFDLPHEDVGRRLVEEASRSGCPSLQRLVLKDFHRWKFAKVEPPFLSGKFFTDEGLHIAGDAFGGNIESAWLSGLSTASNIIDLS